MNIQKILLALILAGFCTQGSTAFASTPTPHLVNTSSFVELLIEKEIIAKSMSERARAIVRMMEAGVMHIQMVSRPRNADSVAVQVSRLIQYSGNDTLEGSDVEGLLLIAENTTSKAIELEAKRGCQVVYRIYEKDSDMPLYDSALNDACKTDEKVTYIIKAGGVRMFDITHRNKDFPLTAGEYRFELEYPGYGKGERVVVVEAKS